MSTTPTTVNERSPLSHWQQVLVVARRLGMRPLLSRSGLLLACCVLFASAVTAALGLFSASVQQALDEDVARFLGAPLVVRSERPLPEQWWQTTREFQRARTAAFTTGAIGPVAYHSIALKAVSDGYPVTGELMLAANDGVSQAWRGAPRPGAAWLDSRAMDELGADLGDTIQVGQAQFTVTRRLTFEPDRLTQLQHVLPRVMIALPDLAGTGLDSAGGSGEFRYLFAGESRLLERLERQLPDLTAAHEVLKPARGSHPFARISERAGRFLGLVSVLILILCGSAAAVLATHIVRRYRIPAAVLRCFGAGRGVVNLALTGHMGLMALVIAAIGSLLGWMLQPLLISALQAHLHEVRPGFSIGPVLSALCIGLAMIVAFVLPRLNAIGRVPVTAALRDSPSSRLSLWPTVFGATGCVGLMLWYYSDNWRLTLLLSVSVLSIITLTAVLGWLLGKTGGQLYRVSRGWLRVGLRAVSRTPGQHIVPMSCIAIAVMAFLLTAMLRGSFLDTLQLERLSHDGNYLFRDLPAAQVNDFRAALADREIELKGLFPTVRAHLERINGVAIDQAVQRESDSREETRSPLRLSWADQPPANNRLLNGAWPQTGSGEVTVDGEVMSDLGLELGDELTFRVGERLLNARISGSRGFVGGGSSVMFWFLFRPEALAPFPTQYMGGMNIEGLATDRLADLARMFPTMRITELEQQLRRIRGIMLSLTRTIDRLMVLLLTAAGVVVVATALTTSEARRQRTALLRVLGLRRRQLRQMLLLEYGGLGLLAGLVGAVSAQWIGRIMFRYQFNLPFQLEWSPFVVLPLLAALILTMLGALFGRAGGTAQALRLLQ